MILLTGFGGMTCYVLAMTILILHIALGVNAAELITAWDWDNATQPISIFRSRPDLLAPILTPLEGIHNRDKMAPGYFFVAPYANMQSALNIYDNNADLVYTSFGSTGTGPIHAPHLCAYHGATHLCFYQGVQHVGWGHGHGVIMNQNYRIVKSVEPSCTYQASSDMHEFQLIENGKLAMMTQYVRSVYDLCPWGLCDGLGYIQSSGFQIIDVDSGECVFGWTSIDHVNPEDSLIPPSSTEISGSGESPEMPWDYFHINSIDKSGFDGGYLISARHTSAIYKIDGKTGGIIWQLGGLKNEYAFDNELGDIDFGFQHDARWVSDSEDESVIAFYDNASNGYTETARYSTGKIVRLNHVTKSARLVEKPLEPPFVDGHAHLSKSQGNYQLDLPSLNPASVGDSTRKDFHRNRLMSFGNDPFFAEYAWSVNDESGTGEWETVFYGAMAWEFMMNYRVLKFNGWEGVPLTKPALWAFSQHGTNHSDNNNTMTLYVSWNGHTKIDSFKFYGANTADAKSHPGSSEWEVVADGFKKNGFETIYMHPRTYRYVYAEAFDINSVKLGRSEVVKTFVPSKLMRDYYCDELACKWMDTNNQDRENMRANMKDNYERWKLREGNNAESDTDYPSKSPSDSDRRRGSSVSYLTSFVVFAIIMSGLFVGVRKRYIGVQRFIDSTTVALRMRVMTYGQNKRGQYHGLRNDDIEVEDGVDESAGVVGFGQHVMNSDHSPSRAKGIPDLEADRQSFLRENLS